MKLLLTDKLTNEELIELKKRVSIMMGEMFMEGITTGRELYTDDLHPDTERLIKNRIDDISKYILDDVIWTRKPNEDNPDLDEIEKSGPDQQNIKEV